MRQIICDCCGVVIKRDLHTFSYLCHLERLLAGESGYVNSDWEPTSGREEAKDVCLYCYNRIMMESVKKFKEMSENRDQILADKERRKKSMKEVKSSMRTTTVDDLPSVKTSLGKRKKTVDENSQER